MPAGRHAFTRSARGAVLPSADHAILGEYTCKPACSTSTDSGASDTGYAVYSWIECDITAWRQVLRAWLDLRNRLFAEFRILPRTELHASLFVNGRGRPSLDLAWNVRKSNRLEASELALDAIGRCADLRVGTVYRRFDRPRDFGT